MSVVPTTPGPEPTAPVNPYPAVQAPASRCRFCGAPLQHIFADLGMSPPSNAYRRPEQLYQMEPFYPLRAYVCRACFLVQLEAFESPEAIFSDYAYFSSYADTWLAHARQYVEMITTRLELGPHSRVIEVACNDGYLLQYFVARGVPVLGVEPAANIVPVAEAKGIPVWVRFFGRATAAELAAQGQLADLLVANNVVAHVPDLNDFIGGFPLVLKPAGVATFEFHHVLELMQHNQFDTIYHEHFCYHSLSTFRQVLAHHGLTVFDVETLGTHGGSLRVYAQHAGAGPQPVSPAVAELLAQEADFGLTRLEPYLAFGERVKAMKFRLLEFLLQAKAQGKTIAAYGAPAKGNTLLNYAGIRTDFVDYTVDRNPHKQGLYLPGTHLPIYSPDKVRETRPDYLLILPWNLQREIVEQTAFIRDWGGQWVVPIPEARVIP
jgi:SAM-dependent methyltransferase